MRWLRSLIRASEGEGNTGSITLPKGAFNVPEGQLFIATKKKNFDTVTLHPIREEGVKVYEVYCELSLDKTVAPFIMKIQEITDAELEGVKMLPIVDGICTKGVGAPCTFDGFITVQEGKEDNIKELETRLRNIVIDGNKIVENVTIEQVV